MQVLEIDWEKITIGAFGDDGNIPYWDISLYHVLPRPENHSEITFTGDSVLNKSTSINIETGEETLDSFVFLLN